MHLKRIVKHAVITGCMGMGEEMRVDRGVFSSHSGGTRSFITRSLGVVRAKMGTAFLGVGGCWVVLW